MLGHEPDHAGEAFHGVFVGEFAVEGEVAVSDLSSRETPRSRVDLPQPLGPMMAVILPLGNSRERSLTMVVSP